MGGEWPWQSVTWNPVLRVKGKSNSSFNTQSHTHTDKRSSCHNIRGFSLAKPLATEKKNISPLLFVFKSSRVLNLMPAACFEMARMRPPPPPKKNKGLRFSGKPCWAIKAIRRHLSIGQRLSALSGLIVLLEEIPTSAAERIGPPTASPPIPSAVRHRGRQVARPSSGLRYEETAARRPAKVLLRRHWLLLSIRSCLLCPCRLIDLCQDRMSETRCLPLHMNN